jgi:UDP-glucose 4-epimerase
MYSSTSAGYGMNSQPNVETQPDDCLNTYSISKVNGEKLCKMYTDLFDLDTVIFRYFNVYGERQPIRGQYAPVIGIFLRQLEAGQPLTIVGDGEQRRDFTYVKDIVNANIMAALSNADKEAYGQVYNVGSGVNYSVNEVAEMISNSVKYIPPRLGEARISLANIDKIYKTFAWKPQQSLESWVKSAVEQIYIHWSR